MEKRGCGMLLPVASLPSKYGIGTFSKEAYEFVDQLKRAGQQYWQILPLGPTGYGDSPYQSFSAFAGNPYFIDLGVLIGDGLLTEEECNSADFGSNSREIDYEKLYFNRFPLLKKAYRRWKDMHVDSERLELSQETGEYCFYMAIKSRFEGKSWELWDEDIRLRRPEAMKLYREELKDEIGFYAFLQEQFKTQWKALKQYANQQGIRIIGDIPIYVAFDSADSWSHPELFQFNEDREPESVAGCPPDGFSPTGQLWGNPLYRWEYHQKTGYEWWLKRMEYSFSLYDVVRVDHFRGFDEYYAVPAGNVTAEIGEWKKGPGIELFNIIKEKMGNLDIIAEDLGFLTPSVLQLLKDSGYPGMKVLEFAFNSGGESDYLPHNYPNNCIVYTGTHDNDTLQGWFGTLDWGSKDFSYCYIGNHRTPAEEIHWDFIRLALSSVAKLAIIPVQDYLGLGQESRINEPSTVGGNWTWRMLEGELNNDILSRCWHMAKYYSRLG